MVFKKNNHQNTSSLIVTFERLELFRPYLVPLHFHLGNPTNHRQILQYNHLNFFIPLSFKEICFLISGLKIIYLLIFRKLKKLNFNEVYMVSYMYNVVYARLALDE